MHELIQRLLDRGGKFVSQLRNHLDLAQIYEILLQYAFDFELEHIRISGNLASFRCYIPVQNGSRVKGVCLHELFNDRPFNLTHHTYFCGISGHVS